MVADTGEGEAEIDAEAATKEKSRFLKKAAQKLLVLLGHRLCRRQTPMAQSNKSFFATFCSQKVAFPSLALSSLRILGEKRASL